MNADGSEYTGLGGIAEEGMKGLRQQLHDVFNGTNVTQIMRDPTLLHGAIPSREVAASRLLAAVHVVERVLKMAVPQVRARRDRPRLWATRRASAHTGPPALARARDPRRPWVIES